MNNKKVWRIKIFICITICIFCVGCTYTERADASKIINVSYDDNKFFDYNDKYVGVINFDESKVLVTEKKTGQSKSKTFKDMPDQIELGDEFIYLLYQNFEKKKDRIEQYDYQLQKRAEMTCNQLSSIHYYDRVLYLSNWKKVDGLYLDYYDLFSENFFACAYIKEKDFGKNVIKIESDSESINIENKTFYKMEKGVYSSEPLIGKYTGTTHESFMLDYDKLGVNPYSDEEYQIRKKITEKINNSNYYYNIADYQKGNIVFGVCTVLKSSIPKGLQQEAVHKSFAYKMDFTNNRISYYGEKTNRIAIIANESAYVYFENGNIVKEFMKTGKRNKLYGFSKNSNNRIVVKGKYLLIEDNDKLIPVKW